MINVVNDNYMILIGFHMFGYRIRARKPTPFRVGSMSVKIPLHYEKHY